jgi:small subunit ribosomal protein S19
MAKKEFTYCSKTIEELKNMSTEDFAKISTARVRRSLRRGFTEEQKTLLKKILKNKKNIETHCRDMVIVPSMIGTTIKVHVGNSYVPVTIEGEMLGHFIGEFALTRKRVQHSAPGVGATRSSASISVK